MVVAVIFTVRPTHLECVADADGRRSHRRYTPKLEV